MRPVLPDDAPSRRRALLRSVAAVSPDDLLVRRIRDALAGDSAEVTERARDVSGLSEAARDTAAIVLAGWTTAAAQRMVIRATVARFPAVPTVIVASISSTGVRKALEAGAYGVVLEAEIETALPGTVRAVLAHQVVVPHRFHREAIRPPLSHREKQTLALVARGLTNREIADHLFLAESTVKTHLASVFGKLGVGSRSEAAALALDPAENVGLSVLDLAPAPPVQTAPR